LSRGFYTRVFIPGRPYLRNLRQRYLPCPKRSRKNNFTFCHHIPVAYLSGRYPFPAAVILVSHFSVCPVSETFLFAPCLRHFKLQRHKDRFNPPKRPFSLRVPDCLPALDAYNACKLLATPGIIASPPLETHDTSHKATPRYSVF